MTNQNSRQHSVNLLHPWQLGLKDLRSGFPSPEKPVCKQASTSFKLRFVSVESPAHSIKIFVRAWIYNTSNILEIFTPFIMKKCKFSVIFVNSTFFSLSSLSSLFHSLESFIHKKKERRVGESTDLLWARD